MKHLITVIIWTLVLVQVISTRFILPALSLCWLGVLALLTQPEPPKVEPPVAEPPVVEPPAKPAARSKRVASTKRRKPVSVK